MLWGSGRPPKRAKPPPSLKRRGLQKGRARTPPVANHPTLSPAAPIPQGDRIAELAARAVASQHGETAAAELLEQLGATSRARSATVARRQAAEAIGAAQEARGVAHPAEPPAPLPSTAAARREARAERKNAKTAARRSRTAVGALQARHERDAARSAADAEALADQALARSGVRWSFRPIARVAWWSAYMAGCDRNGALALAALRSCGMPAHRQAQVLQAATEPGVYQPRREVCRGRRSGQTPFQAPAELVRPTWEGGKRPVSHPAAIRVIQCAVFLWLSRGRTRRAGYAFRVRGFGRGVFAAVCRSGLDAIAGHTAGVPGALVALKQAGFIEYGQPPAHRVGEHDKGPSGFAYLCFWFRQSREEMALEAFHARVAHVATLPYLEQLIERPRLLEERAALQRGLDPPPDIDDADIPF